jgi:hypothetical protein
MRGGNFRGPLFKASNLPAERPTYDKVRWRPRRSPSASTMPPAPSRSVAPPRPVIGRRAAGRIQGLVQDKAQMPFGGVNASRYGCFGGVAGVHEFTELRWITITSGPGHYPI